MFISACHPAPDDSEQTEQSGLPENSETQGEHKHAPTKSPEKLPSCTAAGNSAYYACGTCGLLFKEEACLNQTAIETETLSPTGHKDANGDLLCDKCTDSMPVTIPGGDGSTELPKVEFP